MNKKSALANVAVLVLPLIVAAPISYGIFVFLYRPRVFLASMCALILAGLVLLFLAKLPLYRLRLFFTFGFAGMSARERLFYLLGYLFMLIGVAGVLGLAFLVERSQS